MGGSCKLANIEAVLTAVNFTGTGREPQGDSRRPENRDGLLFCRQRTKRTDRTHRTDRCRLRGWGYRRCLSVFCPLSRDVVAGAGRWPLCLVRSALAFAPVIVLGPRQRKKRRWSNI